MAPGRAGLVIGVHRANHGAVPEGDTVWKLARRLDTALRGRRMARVELRVAALAGAELAGTTLLENLTHGKHLLTRFDDDHTLHTHLRMDGSWTILSAGKHLPRAQDGDVRVVLDADDGPTAYGLMIPIVELLPTAREDRIVGHLGPDPLRTDWDLGEAVRRVGADPERPVALALLDQRNVAGLGNVWANELCFLRGISPWTPVGDTDVAALVRLAARALRHSAFVAGAYQVTTGNNRRGKEHWVAGRGRQPCLRCQTLIRVVDPPLGDREQRRTWWCPRCQPGPTPKPEGFG